MLKTNLTPLEGLEHATNESYASVPARAHARESEKNLEQALVAGVKLRGGMAIKLTSQFHRGLPDRLVLLPYRTVCFVELKSTGAKRTRLQEVAAEQLDTLGFRTFIIDSSADLWEFFMKMDKRITRIEKAIGANEIPTA